MAKILVVGGAGYVGSATVAHLQDQGHEVWVLDDLSTGHPDLILTPHFVWGQAGNISLVKALLETEKFAAVFHFAAKNIVSESVKYPDEYYENNVIQTRSLLDVMVSLPKNEIPVFVFSSTCAIFGDVGNLKIHENLPRRPQSPYGENKWAIEIDLEGRYAARGLRSVALRYFNAAGALADLRAGEWHQPETHLIPRVLQALENSVPIQVFGNQYPTIDGTCVRDYIHVSDLATAHVAAMKRLQSLPTGEGIFLKYNLGSETGHSVKAVIRAAEAVTGKSAEIDFRAPRRGDVPQLIADVSRARTELGFSPRFDLETILRDAWSWEQHRSRLKPFRAVFLDRDDTLNEDPGYISDPDQFNLFPWVAPEIRKLKDSGFLVFVVSNQSGVGRRLIEVEQLHQINFKMNRQFYEQGQFKLNGIANCIHRPEDDCSCRKPKAGLIHKIAKSYRIDLSRSFMIGDRDSDEQVGQNAGCKKSFRINPRDQSSFQAAVATILES